MPADRDVRRTQRAPRSCAPCAKRKLRCDKTIPCISCLKRGEGSDCHRETVTVKGRIVNAAETPPPHVDELRLENIRLKARLAELERDANDDEVPAGDSDHLDALIQGVDFMSMGLSAAPTIPRKIGTSALTLPGQPIVSAQDALLSLMPSRPQTEGLLQWAYKWTWWHHGVYHVPIFKKQMEQLWATGGASARWSWAAMLLAILAESLFYMPTENARLLGFTTDSMQALPELWCRASLHCAMQSDMLVHHSLSAAQTIVILCGIVNALGLSTLHTTLLPIGLAIARSLKLHRLGTEPLCPQHVAGQVCPEHLVNEPHIFSDIEFILRESGRRVWTCLSNQDRLSWQARENRGAADGGDSMPWNMNDVEEGQVAMVMARSTPTMISHVLSMSECAAAVHTYLTSKSHSLTALARLDARLQELNETPWYRDDKLEHVAWARHVWVLCVQHKRLVSHRPFFARSFRQPKYAATRTVCVDAARNILIERRNVLPATYEKVWVVMFNTLAAIVVLAIDFFHTPVGSLPTRRAEIYELLNALTRGLQQNAYVHRANSLLLSLLAEEDKFRTSFVEQLSTARPNDVSPSVADTASSSGNNPLLAAAPTEQVVDPEIWAWLDLDLADGFTGDNTFSGL